MLPLIAPLFALCAAFAVVPDAPVGWFVAVVAGALAPDADLLVLLLAPASAVRLHRGPTHTGPGLAVAALAAGALVHVAGGAPLGVTLALSAAGTAVHVLADVLSIQGLSLSLRRPDRRVAVPVLTATDPWVTVLCGLGVLGAIGFPSGARLVGGGVVVLVAYLVGMRFVLGRRARAAARDALSTPIEGVYPRPDSPARWTVVTRTAEGIQAGVLDLSTRRLSLFDRSPDAADSPALASTLAQAVVARSAFPVARVDGRTVRLRDLRFCYDWPSPPFGADVEIDGEGRPVRERAFL